MKRYIMLAGLILFNSLHATSQVKRPKLMVGIVIDQMRNDYLERYWDKFQDGGFKRLINEGYYCRNTQFTYVPTYTGPGHTSIYTGTTPTVHGIIANDFFDKTTDKEVYCVKDSTVQAVGFPAKTKDGEMSPWRENTSTIGDELKLATNFRGKVIGVSQKDRASILPAGHLANAAYWLSGKNWISSTFYLKKLPDFVNKFNAEGHVAQYLSQEWNTLLPIGEYTESFPDNSPYEGLFPGEKEPVFPHNLPKILKKTKDYDLIKQTPFGNSLTTDFAEAVIAGDSLGADNITDMLCISYSSTDYVGHRYGPQAIEVEDTYLRLDRDLARLFTYLDQHVGKGNYAVFLTADHGAAVNPQLLEDRGEQAGYENDKMMMDSVAAFTQRTYGVGSELIRNYSNHQIFLNDEVIKSHKLDKEDVEEGISEYVRQTGWMYDAVPGMQVKYLSDEARPYKEVKRGYFPARSGDVCLIAKPEFLDHGHKGTSHGTAWIYDAHVPLLWMGWNIPHGSTFREVNIRDIAPTVSMLLHISFPTGTTGTPIEEMLGK